MKQSYGIILEGELDNSFANTESILHCFMVYYPLKGKNGTIVVNTNKMHCLQRAIYIRH